LPARTGRPFSRWSINDLAGEAQRTGLVATISGSTIWRWWHADAIRPWTHRSWIFPRDPDFATKAGRILDLYERVWDGQPLTADDYVISADEKTSIQARRRCHPTTPPGPHQDYACLRLRGARTQRARPFGPVSLWQASASRRSQPWRYRPTMTYCMQSP
jgi:hypothetical protein